MSIFSPATGAGLALAVALALAPALAVYGGAAEPATATGYEIVPLAPPGTVGEALAINRAGQVVGSFRTAAGGGGVETHPFLWLPAAAGGLPAGFHDLGTLGGAFAEARAINDALQVAGWSTREPGSFSRGFLWHGGIFEVLEPVTPGFPITLAHGVNQAGEVAAAEYAFGCRPLLRLPAPAYGLPAGTSVLPTPPGLFEGEAFDVNRHGEVVGRTTNNCDTARSRSYLWLPEPAYGLGAGAHDLDPEAPPEAFASRALVITDEGTVYGQIALFSGAVRPYRWRDGDTELLPLAPGHDSGRVLDADGLGRAVGYLGRFPEEGRAALWQAGGVEFVDQRLPPGSGWELLTAAGIDERDEIVGAGRFAGGAATPYLLRPRGSLLEIPTAGPWALAALALLLAAAGCWTLAGERRRRAAGR